MEELLEALQSMKLIHDLEEKDDQFIIDRIEQLITSLSDGKNERSHDLHEVIGLNDNEAKDVVKSIVLSIIDYDTSHESIQSLAECEFTSKQHFFAGMMFERLTKSDLMIHTIIEAKKRGLNIK